MLTSEAAGRSVLKCWHDAAPLPILLRPPYVIQELGENMETTDTRQKSRTILEGRDRAPARSFLKGMGYSDEDLSKPIVGVAHSWIETM
ncbi:MAG: hypothetical protein M3Q62_11280, partial [Actinomycetota bacterium]|nr:hypothetical protein [Rubrobacteraceae bacterium]MDQ3184093.1 hypothetical protein [Actinomycetota bacterium]